MKENITPLVGIYNPSLRINRNQPNIFDLRVLSKMPDSIIYTWNIYWDLSSLHNVEQNKSIDNDTITLINSEKTSTGLNRKTIKLNAWEIPNMWLRLQFM